MLEHNFQLMCILSVNIESTSGDLRRVKSLPTTSWFNYIANLYFALMT